MVLFTEEPCLVDTLLGPAFRISLLPLLPPQSTTLYSLTEKFGILNDGCGGKSLHLVISKLVRSTASFSFLAHLIVKNKIQVDLGGRISFKNS